MVAQAYSPSMWETEEGDLQSEVSLGYIVSSSLTGLHDYLKTSNYQTGGAHLSGVKGHPCLT